MNERLTTTQFPTPVDTLTRQEIGHPTLSSDGAFATDSSVYSDEAAAWLDEFFDGTSSDTTDPTVEMPTVSTNTLLRPTESGIPSSPQPDSITEEQPQPIPPPAKPVTDSFVREPIDTLALVTPQHRTEDYPFRTYCTSDSQQGAFDHPRFTPHPDTSHPRGSNHTAPIASSPYREVSAQTVYGTQSVLVRPESRPIDEHPLTDNALFQGFVLLLAVTYVLLIYHHLLDIRTLLNRVFHDPTSGERRFQDPGSGRYGRFMRTTTIIGILFIGILVVKYSRPFIAEFPFDRLSFAAEFVLSLAVSVIFLLVIGFQWTLLWLAGTITLTQPLLMQLRQLRKLYFSTAVVLVSPALLLLTLSPPYTSILWFGLIVVALAVTLFLYLRETLTLFLSKKVSIIHWILYLCSVELFPVSLLWQLAVR